MTEDTVAFQLSLRFGAKPIKAVLHVAASISPAARARLATYVDQEELADPILLGQMSATAARTNAAYFRQKILREPVPISLWERSGSGAFTCSASNMP